MNKKYGARYFLLVALVTLAVNATPGFALNGLESAYADVLINNPTRSHARAVLASLSTSSARSSREFTDTVAELIARNSQSSESSSSVNNLFKILERSKRSKDDIYYRYYEFLTALFEDEEKYNLGRDRNALRSKIKAMKGKAKSVEQYRLGDISLENVVARYEDSFKNTLSKPSLNNPLGSVGSEMSVDDVYEHLGQPTSVTIKYVNVVRSKYLYLWLHYLGHGEVSFQMRHRKWMVRNVAIPGLEGVPDDPEQSSETQVPVLQGDELIYTTLLHGSIFHIHPMIKELSTQDAIDVGMLDTMAEMASSNHATLEGAFEVDTYAWICKVLATKGGARYASVLDYVKSTTEHKKLRKYAKVGDEDAPGSDIEQYQMGSVDLATMRAKYPLPFVSS